MTKSEALAIMRKAGSCSTAYLQRTLCITYEEAKEICDILECQEKISLRPFHKGMICPECLRVYPKVQKICGTCPDDGVRERNRIEDLHLVKIGVIR